MFKHLFINDEGATADGLIYTSLRAPNWMNVLVRDAGELARHMAPWPAIVVDKRKGLLPTPAPLSLVNLFELATFAEKTLSDNMAGALGQHMGEAAVLGELILDPQHNHPRPTWIDDLPSNLRNVRRRQVFASLALARLDSALPLLDRQADQKQAFVLVGSAASLLMRAGVGLFWQAADDLTRQSNEKSSGGSKRQEAANKLKATVLEYYREHRTQLPKNKDSAAAELARIFYPRTGEGYKPQGATPHDREATFGRTIRTWLKGRLSSAS